MKPKAHENNNKNVQGNVTLRNSFIDGGLTTNYSYYNPDEAISNELISDTATHTLKFQKFIKEFWSTSVLSSLSTKSGVFLSF